MVQLARQTAQVAQDFARAREDSKLLWRQLMVALGKIREDESLEGLDLDRQPLNLKGRYLAGDASEFECLVPEISPAGLQIEGPWPVAQGAWCVANVADIGIVEGLALEAGQSSFLLGVSAAPWRLQRLASRLAWSIRRDQKETEERRKSERVEMKHSGATLKTLDGRETPCRVFDQSEGGAALHLGSTALYFWVDQEVELDGRRGRVLRYFPGGLVIRFEAAVAEETGEPA